MKHIVTKRHRSEYPDPIALARGDAVAVGERYEGPEGGNEWYFCTVPGGPGGWVPGQIIERLEGGAGRALEDYSARELDVDEGEHLSGARALNGWAWCSRACGGESGWVPLANLRPDD